MPWAFVQSTGQRAATGANAKAFTSNVTAASLLLACVTLETDTATIASIAGGGNTWTAVGSLQVVSGLGAVQVYYAKNAAAGATTVTVTPSAGASELSILEYSGLHPSTPLDVALVATGASTTAAASGSQALAATGELVFGYVVANRSLTVGSGYTQRQADAFNIFTIAEDKVGGTSENVTATLSSSVGAQWLAWLIGFKEPPAPVFVTSSATVFNNTTTPKTVSVSVQAGDLLVAFQITADATAGGSIGQTPTNDGAALTWTMQQVNNTTSNTWEGLWTAVADTTRTIVVTFSASPSTVRWGGNVLVWRNAATGASAVVTGGSGAPTLNLTTTKANSAIVVAVGDWSAVAGAPTWRTNAGAFTSTVELAGDAVTYAARGGYHANAGAVGTYAVGLTAPTGQKFSIIAFEVVGAVLSLEQYAYRGRNDDGNETTATWKAAENTPFTLAPSTTARIRIGVNATGDPKSTQFKLQYRKIGASAWRNADKFV